MPNSKKAQILAAIEGLQTGKFKSKRKAAKYYGISHSTITSNIEKITGTSGGRNKALPPEAEEALKRYCVGLGEALEKKDVMEKANSLLREMGVEKCVSRDWVRRFMTRNFGGGEGEGKGGGYEGSVMGSVTPAKPQGKMNNAAIPTAGTPSKKRKLDAKGIILRDTLEFIKEKKAFYEANQVGRERFTTEVLDTMSEALQLARDKVTADIAAGNTLDREPYEEEFDIEDLL